MSAMLAFELSSATDRLFYVPEVGMTLKILGGGELQNMKEPLVAHGSTRIRNSVVETRCLGVSNAKGESVTLGALLDCFADKRAGDLRFEYIEGGMPQGHIGLFKPSDLADLACDRCVGERAFVTGVSFLCNGKPMPDSDLISGGSCVAAPLGLRDLGGMVWGWPYGNKFESLIETSGSFLGHEKFAKEFWEEYANCLPTEGQAAGWFAPPLRAVSDLSYWNQLGMLKMYGGSRGTDGQMKPASVREVFLKKVGLTKSDILLDVGHGRGSVFYLLHFWGCAPKQMLGIDFDPVKAYESTIVRDEQEIYFKERGHPMDAGPSRLRLMAGDITDLDSIEPATVVFAAWQGWPPEAKMALMSLFERSATATKIIVLQGAKGRKIGDEDAEAKHWGPNLKSLTDRWEYKRFKVSCGSQLSLQCYTFEKLVPNSNRPLPQTSCPLMTMPELLDSNQMDILGSMVNILQGTDGKSGMTSLFRAASSALQDASSLRSVNQRVIQLEKVQKLSAQAVDYVSKAEEHFSKITQQGGGMMLGHGLVKQLHALAMQISRMGAGWLNDHPVFDYKP